MRLIAFILLAGCLQVSARGFSQNITLSEKNVPLRKIFKDIHKQTGFQFFYKDELLEQASVITLDVRDEPLEQVLARCFQGLPFTYSVVGNAIVVKEKVRIPPLRDTVLVFAAYAADMHGIVTDSLGVPLAGASIIVKGSRKGTATDGAGNFTLNNIPSNATLIVSFAGYERQEVKLNNNVYLHIVLQRDNSPLNALHVIAYGTSTRRFDVGAVSTVSAEQIERQPVTNVLLALEGQVPGLTVSPGSGAPGSSVQVQIRGQNTMRSSLQGLNPYDQPLFIIDGVPLAAQNQNINLLASLGAGTYGNANPYGGISPINGINPADIESISVLKDADATSIYGTQGANGVILITTKKGHAGKTDLNIVVNTGPHNATRQVQMLNTQQYLQYRRESLQNGGIDLATASPLSYPELFIFDTTRSVDWFHQLFGKTANNTDVHASVSGGSANTTFIFSGGYTRATYNFPGDFADNRWTLHSGFHHNSNDHRLTLEFGTDYSFDDNNSSAQPAVGTAMLLPPDLPSLIDPTNGKLVWTYKGVDLSGYPTYSYLKQPNELQSYSLNNTFHVGYRLLDGLTISADMGYSRLTTTEISQYPIASLNPRNTTGSAQFGNSSYQTINIEPQLDYKRKIGKGVLSILAGVTYKKNTGTSMSLEGDGYTNDALLGSLTKASSIQISSDNNTIYKYDALFGRIGYVYDQKYILHVTGRRDGASNFGPGHQFGSFGSVGAGWIFSEEGNFKAALPFISYAKLSGSYGTNGSDGIAPYMFQSYWTPPNYTPTFQNLQPYAVQNLYNPDYSWDTKKALNLGLDLGFFHDRLLVNATWYRNRIGNQLVNANLPDQTGFPSVLENFNCTVQNTGWEFTLSSTNFRSRDFSWTTNFNITFNSNKVIAFPGLTQSSYASTYAIGKSTSIVNGFRYKGVNDTTGLFEYYTQKGASTYTPNYGTAATGGDQQFVADLQPKFYGGFGNTFNYKKFGLTLFFQFNKQMGYNYLYGIYSAFFPGVISNVPVQMLNHWRKPYDHAPIEKLISGFAYPDYVATSDFTQSSGAYSDASYIRLKTVSFNYTLPAAALKKIGIRDAHVYINVQNLLTITGYKVGDPEMPGRLYAIPMQRTIAGGLSFNF